MTRPAAFRFAPGKVLFPFLGVAVLALAPQFAFAQHSAGGHAGGGVSSGGASSGSHYSGGGNPGGGTHFSSPPPPQAPHYSPPPAPHFSPPPPPPARHFSTPAAAIPPRTLPAVSPVANNAAEHTVPVMRAPAGANFPRSSSFNGAPISNGGANGPSVLPDRHVTIGFPPTEAVQPAQVNSTPSASPIEHAGQPLRFVGEGHRIWSEPTGAAINSSSSNSSSRTGSVQTSSSALAGRTFRGAAGLTPASADPNASLHIHPPHRRFPPINNYPGFGTFGFGSPYYYGSPYYFGDPFFFANSFTGFEFGSVWVPCNSAGGIGFLCAPYNSDYGYQLPYDSLMSVGTDTGTQSQEIFSPYSPSYPPAEENSSTNAASPDEYVLFLKNGSVYVVNDYWFEDGKLVYSTATGQDSVNLDQIDMQKTLDVNAKRGLVFTLRPAPPNPDTAPQQSEPPAPQNDRQPQPNQNAPAPANPNQAPQP